MDKKDFFNKKNMSTFFQSILSKDKDKEKPKEQANKSPFKNNLFTKHSLAFSSIFSSDLASDSPQPDVSLSPSVINAGNSFTEELETDSDNDSPKLSEMLRDTKYFNPLLESEKQNNFKDGIPKISEMLNETSHLDYCGIGIFKNVMPLAIDANRMNNFTVCFNKRKVELGAIDQVETMGVTDLNGDTSELEINEDETISDIALSYGNEQPTLITDNVIDTHESTEREEQTRVSEAEREEQDFSANSSDNQNLSQPGTSQSNHDSDNILEEDLDSLSSNFFGRDNVEMALHALETDLDGTSSSAMKRDLVERSTTLERDQAGIFSNHSEGDLVEASNALERDQVGISTNHSERDLVEISNALERDQAGIFSNHSEGDLAEASNALERDQLGISTNHSERDLVEISNALERDPIEMPSDGLERDLDETLSNALETNSNEITLQIDVTKNRHDLSTVQETVIEAVSINTQAFEQDIHGISSEKSFASGDVNKNPEPQQNICSKRFIPLEVSIEEGHSSHKKIKMGDCSSPDKNKSTLHIGSNDSLSVQNTNSCLTVIEKELGRLGTTPRLNILQSFSRPTTFEYIQNLRAQKECTSLVNQANVIYLPKKYKRNSGSQVNRDVEDQRQQTVYPMGEYQINEMDWNWENIRKQSKMFDDGTRTFFWRTHTVTMLFFLTCLLVYVAIFENPSTDSVYNIQRGICACVFAFLLLGVTQVADGPFVRPHPVYWKLAFSCSTLYEIVLIYLLFQTPDEARKLLTYIDSNLGKPLEERSYGNSCMIYDSDHPTNPFHNVYDKLDMFVPTHFFGWWIKTLIFRDWWFCTVFSIMFEILEYTLEHQLPNFEECWWDHWIMDAILCNGLGIYLGLRTLRYLSIKPYYWQGLWSIPTYKGKLKRIAAQFGPHDWTQFDWKPTSSLSRWVIILTILAMLLLGELNTFYLKYVLWLDPGHFLNVSRAIMILSAAAVAFREFFQYMTDPKCDNVGRQAWILTAIVITEFLLIAKYDWKIITKPIPVHIFYLWIVGFCVLFLYTCIRFKILSFIFPRKWAKNKFLQFIRDHSSKVIAESAEELEELQSSHSKSTLVDFIDTKKMA